MTIRSWTKYSAHENNNHSTKRKMYQFTEEIDDDWCAKIWRAETRIQIYRGDTKN